MDPFLLLLAAGVVVLAAIGGQAYARRPRLRVEARLRGGTRNGTLYVTLTHLGGRPVPDANLSVHWTNGASKRLIASRDLGEVEPHTATRYAFKDLHGEVAAEVPWREIRVHVQARRVAAEAVLPLASTSRERPSEEPAVRYERGDAPPCVGGGPHRFQSTRFVNEGVVERWDVCARCRWVHKHPLSPEDEARQAHARHERAAREQRRMEEEWAKRKAQEPGGSRQKSGHDGRRRAPPPEVDDSLPPTVAFWILELDAETATWEDVLQAHRRLAKQFHPDKSSGADPRTKELLQARMQDVNRAKDRLRDHFPEPQSK